MVKAFQNYPQKLTTQRKKSFESLLSSSLMRVKLVVLTLDSVLCEKCFQYLDVECQGKKEQSKIEHSNNVAGVVTEG